MVKSGPGAAILVVSAAVSAATQSATRRQILVKGSVNLEQIGGAKVYCFDEARTITTAQTEVAKVICEDDK